MQGLAKAKGMRFADGLCLKHGAFRAMAPGDADPVCPQCRDEADREESRRRQMAIRVDAIRRSMGIPARFSEKGFRDWTAQTEDQAVVRNAVAEYMREVRKNPHQWKPLILTGTIGTGKTHIVCSLVKNLAECGISARYTTLQSLLDDIKAAYSSDMLTEAGQILRFVKAEFLVIDEFDVGRGSENDKALLFAVINGRYNELRPTVVVSNQKPEDLAAIVTDRVMSRLQEGALTLRCDWADARAAA